MLKQSKSCKNCELQKQRISLLPYKKTISLMNFIIFFIKIKSFSSVFFIFNIKLIKSTFCCVA